MTEQPLTADELEALWRYAAHRLSLVDLEPTVSEKEVNAVGNLVGARPEGLTLSSWLKGGAQAKEALPSGSNNVLSLAESRTRFRPVTTFVRLAADSAGTDVGLPSRSLETSDGQFRLSFSTDEQGLCLTLQALGMASTEWAGRRMGLAGATDDQPIVAVFTFDEDGDATIVIEDTPWHRQALLSTIIGAIDDDNN